MMVQRLFTILMLGAVLPVAAIDTSQPMTLDGAVAKVQDMRRGGASRAEISAWVTSVVDGRIQNANSPERVFAHWKHVIPLELAGRSDKDLAFNQWRKQGGAEQSYDVAAKWAWEHRYGQCAENTAVTYYILKTAGFDDVRIINRPDHRFVLWGLEDEADPNNLRAYTERVFAVDGWQGRSLQGDDIIRNYYTSPSYKRLVDATADFDRKAREWCGFLGKPCCTSKPACRDDPSLVCALGKCWPCGKRDRRCCDNQICEEGDCLDGYCRTQTTQSTDDSGGVDCTSRGDREAIDLCFYQKAVATGNASLCAMISPDSSWRRKCIDQAGM